jgi:pimeloyl-ACP methyl ester carboxylesterase
MNFEDKFIEVENIVGQTIRFRYWDEGEGDIVILVHGIGVSIEIWSYLVEDLSQSYRVICPDFPGHGKTTSPIDTTFFTLENHVTSLEMFLEALQLEPPFTIIGSSVGGTMSVLYTSRRPEKVCTLILANPTNLGTELNFIYRSSNLFPIADILMKFPSRFSVKQFMRITSSTKGVPEEFFTRMLTYLRSNGTQRSILYSLRAETTLRQIVHPLTTKQLSSINIPTLLIWGIDDPVSPLQHIDVALEHIPDIRVVLFENCKHGPQIERPDTFIHFARQFIENGKLSPEVETRKKINV